MNKYDEHSEHIDVEDLALYALLLLSEEEAAAAEEHERGCAFCRSELMRVREGLAMFALGSVEPVAVPDGARSRFLTKLGGTGAAGDATGSVAEPTRSVNAATYASELVSAPVSAPVPISVRPRRPAARILPWVGWAAAAAAIVVAAGLKQDRDSLREVLATQNQQTARLQVEAERDRHILQTLTSPLAVRANLTVPKAPAIPSARATYEQKSGVLLLQASNLLPLPTQKVYELWLIPADGSAPLAAGTFRPDAHGNGNLLVPSFPGAVAAKAFGITVEAAGGSATPTLPILLAGAPV